MSKEWKSESGFTFTYGIHTILQNSNSLFLATLEDVIKEGDITIMQYPTLSPRTVVVSSDIWDFLAKSIKNFNKGKS